MRSSRGAVFLGFLFTVTLTFLAWTSYSDMLPAYELVPEIESAVSIMTDDTSTIQTQGVIEVPGAPSLDPKWLLQRDIQTIVDTVGSVNGITKLFHQSWGQETLPKKFKAWSDSCRQKHPDWKWVLWTDEANDALVEQHFPTLKETYWSFRTVIERADFCRNLYMIKYGGIYADLDTECLRPLVEVFEHPDDFASPHYPIQTVHQDTHHAFVGLIETATVPNAFMASSPNHPLWLYPISEVLNRFGADSAGAIGELPEGGIPEEFTGPAPLERGIVAYHGWDPEIDGNPFAPALAELAKLGPARHNLIILDEPIIYPFSWSWHDAGVWDHCKAQGDNAFDPRKCHELLKAYERGARTIAYWSHTWQYDGGEPDLRVVGH